jgi:dCMP deaminase
MYMDIALRSAQESKCPRKHVGCCVLLESGMIAIGFNGYPSGGPNEWKDTGNSNPEVIHAEMNALGKLLEEGVSAKGATVYVTYSPCLECAKLLVRSKVKRVVYLEAYRKTEGIDYLAKYGVEVEKYPSWYPEGYSAIDFVIHVHEDGRITNEGTICCL